MEVMRDAAQITGGPMALHEVVSIPRDAFPHLRAGYAQFRANSELPHLTDLELDPDAITSEIDRSTVVMATLGLIAIHDDLSERTTASRRAYESLAYAAKLHAPQEAATDVPAVKPPDATENLRVIRRHIGELGNITLRPLLKRGDLDPTTLAGMLQRALERLELPVRIG